MSSLRRPLVLGVRFVLECCALVALGYWGWQTGDTATTRLALAVGTPLVAAVFWGLFVSPKAAVAVSGRVRLLVELAVFGAAVAALALAGRPTLAAALALALVVNALLSASLDRR